MKPYIPKKLPLRGLDWESFVPLISWSNRQLARYDGLLQSLPNASVLLSPLTTREAVLSSKIEGTRATLEDVLKYEAKAKMEESEKKDIREIINYRAALKFAIKELKKKPLCLNTIKRMHSILLQGVRGRNRMLGRFRTVQNWIGPPDSSIDEAHFIQPTPEKMKEALDNFEKYLHHNEKDSLVQLAIIHAQFEIIHPFVDGNGRIGRILIPLFLYEKKILNSPMFYISAYFERNRKEYYRRLREITESNAWDAWIRFFLKAVGEQADENNMKAKKILDLYNDMKEDMVEVTRSQFAIKVLDFIFKVPIFSTAVFYKRSRIPKASATRIIEKLRKAGIISVLQEAKGRTPAIYIFPKLISIVE